MKGSELERLRGGDILSVPGWSGAAVHCGLKSEGALDLALLSSAAARVAAGVFTKNRLPAAPVRWCRERLAVEPRARSIVINAGNANALTGSAGEVHARRMAEHTERHCGAPAMVLSTGVIGVPLPIERVLAGIHDAATQLTHDAGAAVAEAMRTTDTFAKRSAVRLRIPTAPKGAAECTVTVGGVAKGSGMIHPDMATMLAVIATDAELDAAATRRVLQRAVDASFHEITVDGDTSTNDTVLLLTGGADMAPIGLEDGRLSAIEHAVTAVAADLAEQIVRDGEGASRVMELSVQGAAQPSHARRVARAIAESLLVKTALAGADPNWGRILAAAANAGVPLEPERIALSIGGCTVFERGRPITSATGQLSAAMALPRVRIELHLGAGDGRARMLSCDLTKGYVAINSEYTT